MASYTIKKLGKLNVVMNNAEIECVLDDERCIYLAGAGNRHILPVRAPIIIDGRHIDIAIASEEEGNVMLRVSSDTYSGIKGLCNTEQLDIKAITRFATSPAQMTWTINNIVHSEGKENAAKLLASYALSTASTETNFNPEDYERNLILLRLFAIHGKTKLAGWDLETPNRLHERLKELSNSRKVMIEAIQSALTVMFGEVHMHYGYDWDDVDVDTFKINSIALDRSPELIDWMRENHIDSHFWETLESKLD